MEFLKSFFGDKSLSYDEFVNAINAYNEDAANKEKQIKVENVASGEYIGKRKYQALQELLDGKETELKTANTTIAELKKLTKGDEDAQKKINAYEKQVEDLQAELARTKIKSAIKVALLSEHCSDVDYISYKLHEKMKENDESLELDENDNIKGWDNKISDLKNAFPSMFQSASGTDPAGNGGFKPYDPAGLPAGSTGKSVTKEQFASMSYEDRVKLKKENEELYRQLAK